MTPASTLAAVALVALAGVTACGDDADAPDGDDAGGTVAEVSVPSGSASSGPSPTDAPAATVAPTPSAPSTVPASDPSTVSTVPPVPASGAARRAIADLAERQGVDQTAIVTISIENVTWRDTALGCPRKGLQYAQVLTDGVRIVLELDGRRYQYHGGRGRAPFYCPRPEAPVGE